jgi:hypothetical protein
MCFFYFVSQRWLEAEELLAMINKIAEKRAIYYKPVFTPMGLKGGRRWVRGDDPRGKP